MRAQGGTFLRWSEKEQLKGKKGESIGGKSSRGPDLCEAGQRVMGQRELQLLTNAVDKKG